MRTAKSFWLRSWTSFKFLNEKVFFFILSFPREKKTYRLWKELKKDDTGLKKLVVFPLVPTFLIYCFHSWCSFKPLVYVHLFNAAPSDQRTIKQCVVTSCNITDIILLSILYLMKFYSLHVWVLQKEELSYFKIAPAFQRFFPSLALLSKA